MIALQHTILVMVSTVDVDAHFNNHPLATISNLDRIKHYTRTALARHLLLDPEQFQIDADAGTDQQVRQPVSLQHNAAEFFRVLEHVRHQWRKDLKSLFDQLGDTLSVTTDSGRAQDDLLEVVNRILGHIQRVIRSTDSRQQKSLFQPALFEILSKVAWLFSGYFDEGSIFFDLPAMTSRIPEQEEVCERHSVTTKMGGDFWILPVMLSL